MADYKLWNALKDAQKISLGGTFSLAEQRKPLLVRHPGRLCGAGKDRVGLGKPELECLIQTFKFPGQFGTHIDFPGHFIKGKALSEKYDVNDLNFPAGGH